MEPVPPAAEAPRSPRPKLFSPWQAAVVSALGVPIAGMTLAAITLRRAGRPRAAWVALGIGVGATALAVGVAFLFAEWKYRLHLAPSYGVVTYYAARYLMGPPLAEQSGHPAFKASWWITIGVGLASAAAVVLLVVVSMMLPGPACQSITFGSGDEVRFRDEGMRADAERLGSALVNVGVFGTDHPKSVFLEWDQGCVTVSFFLKPGTWQENEKWTSSIGLGSSSLPASLEGKP